MKNWIISILAIFGGIGISRVDAENISRPMQYPKCECSPGDHFDVADVPGAHVAWFQAGYSNGFCRAMSLTDDSVPVCKLYAPFSQEEINYVEKLLGQQDALESAGRNP
jgi:hypothetical protein